MKGPGGVVAEVLTVSEEVPEPFGTGVGLNEQVGGGETTGVMVQVRATALLKPCKGAMVTVVVAGEPWTTEAGASAGAAIVKSGAAVTVRPTTVL